MEITKDEIEIKLRAYNDLYYFTKNILGYSDLVPHVHGELCRFIQFAKTKVLLDNEPRDHFKTSCISVGYSMWMIINHPDIRILLSHKVLKKSKEIMGEIQEHFEKNRRFRHFFGDWVGTTPWGKDGLTVSKRTRVVREPTITPGGVDHEITSSHYDLIINDDLAGLKDMYSLAERDHVKRYYRTLKYLRDRKRFIREINVGTRWHMDDISNHLKEKVKDISIRVTQAIIDENTKNPKVFLDTRYTLQELLEEKAEDPIMFASQRQNDPRPLESQLYNIDELSLYDHDSFKPGYTAGYVDPAFGKKISKTENEEPCYFCFCIGSLIKDKIYIIDWIVNRKKPDQNNKLIVEKIKEHKIKMLGFETNAGQSVWADNLKKIFKKREIILTFEDVNHLSNKDRRIQGMHGAVKNNVLFREDWEEAYPEAMQQLLLYPQHKFKDAPDGLEGLIDIAGNKKEPGISFND